MLCFLSILDLVWAPGWREVRDAIVSSGWLASSEVTTSDDDDNSGGSSISDTGTVPSQTENNKQYVYSKYDGMLMFD